MGNIPEMKRIMSMAADAPRSEAHLPLGFSTSTTFPYFAQWTKLYEGRGPLLGKGLITSNGAVWFHQRKTIAPQLFMDKVKGNLNIMVESASNLGPYEELANSDNTQRDSFLQVCAPPPFLFLKFDKRCKFIIRFIFAFLPNATDIYHQGKSGCMETRERDSRFTHRHSKGNPEAASDKMAQIIMESAKTGELGPSTPDQYIVDNCKDVYLAGFEVTAVATLWGLVLLASNPEWQARLRAEILEVCGGHVPDTNMLGKMKLLKMVIQEVLRLYPGVAFVSRQTLKDVKLGDILVPKGVNIWIWIPALHQDPELWGSDAEKFNPERFANGISGACKSPNAYIPFGVGTRMCPGQNLAITEMKILFTIILSHFSLSISPNYLHSPRLNLLLEPEYGVNLIIRKI
ncbi:Cytochrome P450 714C2 [Vitis vinifera]|uniref:Cytochrome P450 714C2 n=1 Tax=Vitis vinifera TaxID=29760 RepID=A0A438DGT1_VITVI|nr:Cytochrome P450 714C2 [Vitis vinifera]